MVIKRKLGKWTVLFSVGLYWVSFYVFEESFMGKILDQRQARFLVFFHFGAGKFANRFAKGIEVCLSVNSHWVLEGNKISPLFEWRWILKRGLE